MTNTYYNKAEETINRIKDIPSESRKIMIEQRFKQNLSNEFLELIKCFEIIGKESLVEEALLEALKNTPKYVQVSFWKSIFHIINKEMVK